MMEETRDRRICEPLLSSRLNGKGEMTTVFETKTQKDMCYGVTAPIGGDEVNGFQVIQRISGVIVGRCVVALRTIPKITNVVDVNCPPVAGRSSENGVFWCPVPDVQRPVVNIPDR